MGYFWMAYFIHLIPFFIVNGVLTAKPVVLYHAAEIIGPRLYTIPIEDSVYALTCLLLPITIIEFIFEIKTQRSKTALI
jgi:lycopene cyclase domain-containing protein